MKPKNIVMRIDLESGIKTISFAGGEVSRTVSLADEGCNFLDSKGADIILDFDNNGKLINIQLMGL